MPLSLWREHQTLSPDLSAFPIDRPPPQEPHLRRPDRSRFDFLRGWVSVDRLVSFLSRTRIASSSSTIRRCGTSLTSHLSSGLGLETLFPVFGSSIMRTLFHTSLPR